MTQLSTNIVFGGQQKPLPTTKYKCFLTMSLTQQQTLALFILYFRTICTQLVYLAFCAIWFKEACVYGFVAWPCNARRLSVPQPAFIAPQNYRVPYIVQDISLLLTTHSGMFRRWWTSKTQTILTSKVMLSFSTTWYVDHKICVLIQEFRVWEP